MKTTGRGSKAGLRIERRFTAEKEDAYSGVEWTTRTSRITNPDGTVVFEMADAEVPAEWSQVASDIMVSKYFRKAGVPQPDGSGHPILGATGDRPADRRLAALGREQRLLCDRRRCQGLRGRAGSHACPSDGGAELTAMVQHGAGLGVWDHWTGAGSLFRGSHRWSGQSLRRRLHTSSTPRVLHPERERLAGRTGGSHGPLGSRGADLQVWLGNRDEFLRRAGRGRAAFRRWHLVRLD